MTSKASAQPAHTRSLIRAFDSRLSILWLLSYWLNTILEFLSLKGGCRGSSESTHVKMPHCWKSHVTAQIWHPLIYCSTYFQAHSHPITSFSLRPQHYFYWMSPFSLESHLTGEACDYFLLSIIIAQNYVLACVFCIVWCQQISIWNKHIESSLYFIKQVGKCLKSRDQIRREHRKSRF